MKVKFVSATNADNVKRKTNEVVEHQREFRGHLWVAGGTNELTYRTALTQMIGPW